MILPGMASLMDRYPGIDDLERRASKRIPFFAWEYLASGTGDESSVRRNRTSLTDIVLRQEFLKGMLKPNTETTLFGRTYASPIGIAPVGMTGLIWPGADTALAKAAADRNIPHTLSTVATTAPEVIGPLTQGNGWFQLYPPRDPEMRADILGRVRDSGYETLVVTADIPAPSRRERQRKAQIRVPPSIGPTLVAQAAIHPAWAMGTVRNGLPRFKMLEKYVDRATMRQTAGFVGASLGGTLSWDYMSQVRDLWDGPLVIKGILDPADAQRCVDIGMDGVQISNHGGRQLEAALGAAEALPAVVDQVGGKIKVLFDSGIRGGADVARAMALGADFVFCGRAFMFGLGALGDAGAGHAFDVLHDGLVNVMHQTGCATLDELPSRLVPTTPSVA